MSTPILLLSCYELGHQPLSLAWALAVLRAHGVDAQAVDLAVEEFPDEAASQARFVAVAVPMHTALRLGVDAVQRIRQVNPCAHICFIGHYAWLNRAYLLAAQGAGTPVADSVLAGEMEETLAALAQAVLNNGDWRAIPGVTWAGGSSTPQVARLHLPLPDRSPLAPLNRYARYMAGGESHLAGYVEASRGCLHTCRHCPVVPVYRGRFVAVPADIVMADIRQQVAAGAAHITFGDPDYLNGPGHARKLAQMLHAEFPWVSFDFTTKVEHILEHRDLIPELAACGATFVVSAFESTSDRVLAKLRKGHTLADMDAALAVLRQAGLAPQPTWMPFTPWTTLDDYLAMLAWIRSRGLIAHVPPVQLSIRMLVPPGSALLDESETAEWLGELDAANFTYRWASPDPRLDQLQQEVTCIAEQAGDGGNAFAFAAVEAAAYLLAGRTLSPASFPVDEVAPPRMSEHWFC